MKIFVRLVTVSVLVLALITPLFAGQKTTPKEREDAYKVLMQKKMNPTNKYGFPVRDAKGNPIYYSKKELERQRASAPQPPKSLTPPPAVSSPKLVPGSMATWGYARFGSGIGASNIVVSTVSGNPEIYIGGNEANHFGPDNFWHAIRYNSATGDYDTIFVSTYFTSNIVTIHVAEILSSNAGDEIIVVLSNGTIHLYSKNSKMWLNEYLTGINNVEDVEIADVDSDSNNEFVIVTDSHLYIYAHDGGHQRDTDTFSGRDIVIADMDADANLEIASNTGLIYDYVNDIIEWDFSIADIIFVEAADIDGDNMAELIAAKSWNDIYAFDVDTQSNKWTIDMDALDWWEDIATIHLDDIDNDNVIELIIGTGQRGEIRGVATDTLTLEWVVDSQEHGITDIATYDVDSDNTKELMWGGGWTSTAEDIFFVNDWQTDTVEWQNVDLGGPLLGPLSGDVNGDGLEELVVVSRSSNETFDEARILVFNRDHELLAISNDPDGLDYVYNVALYDVDGDNRMEIVICGIDFYGRIQIYDYNADDTFTQIWESPAYTDGNYLSVGVGDVDGDTELEIIGGTNDRNIHIYDYTTAALESTIPIATTENYVEGLVVGDFDGDTTLEIAALLYEENVYVYNGITHNLDDTITGPFTCLSAIDGNFLATGDEFGNLRIYTQSGGSYTALYLRTYGTDPIHGISPESTLNELHFGNQGRLNIHNSLGLQWISEQYSPTSTWVAAGNFGEVTTTLDSNTGIYTAGTFSVNAFDYTLSEAGILTLTRPNGGEQWVRNTNHNITWISSADVGNVDILYSIDNGVNWTTIVSSTANDGSYTWTVPDTPSNQCIVRIAEVGTLLADESDRNFAIVTQYVPPSITVTTPNGGERWEAGSWHTIHWTWTGSLDNVNVYYSLDNGSSWTTIATNKYNTGATAWKVPSVTSDLALIRVKDAASSTKDQSDAVFSIVTSAPATIALSHGEMKFSAIANGAQHTGDQYFSISNTGGSTLNWMVSDDATWLTCDPSSGTQYGRVSVQVDNTGLRAGDYVGTITVSDPDATNGAGSETIKVYLNVMNETAASPPMGQFSTPLEGASVSSSIPVTGWAIDDIEVVSVKIYNGKSYVGDATFVEGARPDIAAMYPDYPFNNRAGWGYMLLTNFLPNGGNGTYTLNAYATDTEGNEVHLGSRTIYCNNNGAVKPFGAIDAPDQGGNATGDAFINWGWALTPMPNSIPIDGSTIYVWIDGVKLGNPTEYNLYRSDIFTLFRDYANSKGAVGYYKFDTTTYNNGVHTIQWTVTDTGGNTDGIGSRYFNIHNIGGDGLFSANSRKSQTNSSPTGDLTPLIKSIDLEQLPVDFAAPARVKTTYRPDFPAWTIFPDKDGIVNVQMIETGLLEVAFAPGTYLASPLPVGATMVPQTGKFHWQPGAGFLGMYTLDFIKQDPDGHLTRYKLNITINPRN